MQIFRRSYNGISKQRMLQIHFKPTFSQKSISKKITSLNPAKDKPYNLTPKIISLCDRKLFKIQNHPLTIMKNSIENILGTQFNIFDDISPIVTVDQNFEALNIQKDHVSRQSTDTFYINHDYVLRTHTSAHEKDFLSQGLANFVVFGDVYRRDQIDRYHYPAFHQMEAVKVLGKKGSVSVEQAVVDLKKHLQKIAFGLYGECQMRWVDAYFPFTEPSFQLQVFFDGKWVQMLGCGILHQRVMDRAGRGDQIAWAAGLGLQRFAMRLFKIPDVRLFWSEDKRFIDQFTAGKISQFKQFSKYPVCYKDFSMYISPSYNANNLFSLIRQVAGDLIQNVQHVQTYQNKKINKTSKTYRICFRSLERTLTNQQITKIQFDIRDKIKSELEDVQLRG